MKLRVLENIDNSFIIRSIKNDIKLIKNNILEDHVQFGILTTRDIIINMIDDHFFKDTYDCDLNFKYVDSNKYIITQSLYDFIMNGDA
jgi:hypothetical protein